MNKEIAYQCGITTDTTKTQLSTIYRALGISGGSSRVQLANWANANRAAIARGSTG